MSVESDISELKTDIKWIKQSLQEIKKEKNLNKGYLIGIIGSTLIAISGLLGGLCRWQKYDEFHKKLHKNWINAFFSEIANSDWSDEVKFLV